MPVPLLMGPTGYVLVQPPLHEVTVITEVVRVVMVEIEDPEVTVFVTGQVVKVV